MRSHKTNEGKIALQIAKLIEGVTIDLDQVGVELARLQPATHYNRLILVAESAVEEQEKNNVRYNSNPIF